MNFWVYGAISLSIFIAGFGTATEAMRLHYRPIIADMKLKAAEERSAAADAKSKAIMDNAELTNKLETEHEQANNALNAILDRPAPRVRIPSCVPSAISQAQPASGVSGTVEASGILLRATQEILGADRQRTESIIAEAERELIVCRVSKDWAKAQSKPD